jgi:hypothetical protein
VDRWLSSGRFKFDVRNAIEVYLALGVFDGMLGVLDAPAVAADAAASRLMFDMASNASLSQNTLGEKIRETPAVNVPNAMPANDLPMILNRVAAQSHLNALVNVRHERRVYIVRTPNTAPSDDESSESKARRTQKQPIQTTRHNAHSISSHTH